MKQRIIIIVKLLLFWLLFFEVSRLFFVVYNWASTVDVSIVTLAKSFFYGFQHDASLLGYIVAISSLICMVSLFVGRTEIYEKIFSSLTLACLIPFSLLTVADAELYRNWGYRTDCSALEYLAMPKEAMSSIPLWHLLLLLFAVALICVGFYFLYKKWIRTDFENWKSEKYVWSIAFFAIMAFCIIPIRGGLGVATLRTGSVYFCSQPFANHAAINDHWHFIYSFGYSKKEVSDVFIEKDECENICASMLQSKGTKPIQLINQNRPNVLLFILESFTANQIGCLGGQPGITPNLDSIAKTGILFSNCYGNGTKSEMGVVSILSGYPAQPTTAIIKYNEKVEKLPYLSGIFDSLGYNLSFFHGGDIRFGNMNSYFRYGGFDKCVTIADFDKKDGDAKWGAYDHVVFNRLLNDLHEEKEPFFSVCYTLSSHEPFDVPMKSEFLSNTYYSRFLNSLHYADSCIGDFMRKAVLEDWWKNTVVIFVSDHGSRITKDAEIVSTVDKFHIPMIWCGGAVEKDSVISDLICQCDLPKMLCNQLNVNSERFNFSKDVLCGDNPFAFYAFYDGFGYLRENQFFSWDNTNSSIIDKTEVLNDTTILQGKAFLQKVTTDFCEK